MLKDLTMGHFCRFLALVKLEQKLAENPNKKLLMAAIAKKRLGQFDSFFDHLHTEMIITGMASTAHAAHEWVF